MPVQVDVGRDALTAFQALGLKLKQPYQVHGENYNLLGIWASGDGSGRQGEQISRPNEGWEQLTHTYAGALSPTLYQPDPTVADGAAVKVGAAKVFKGPVGV